MVGTPCRGEAATEEGDDGDPPILDNVEQISAPLLEDVDMPLY